MNTMHHTDAFFECLYLVTPGSNTGSTSTCPWLCSEKTLPAYWLVCKFDLILAVFLVVFSVLTSVQYYCLPLALVSMYSYCLPSPHMLYTKTWQVCVCASLFCLP